jgi:hypothetical protein
MSSRKTDRSVFFAATLVAGALAGCQPEPSVEGDWVWRSEPDDDESVKIVLALEEDDSGEVDSCKFSETFTEKDDEEVETEVYKGKCEVTRQSDGGFEIELSVTSYVEDEGEGEGPEDEFGNLSEGERKLRWDCSLLEEEDQLECWEDGGDYFELSRD